MRAIFDAMAQVHGNVANYPARKRRELLLWMLGIVLVVEALAGIAVGIGIGASLVSLPVWARLLMLYGGGVAVVIVYLLASRWMKANEPGFFAHVKGAEGESAVADELKRLPFGFHVLHGVDTPNGDIDHLVIGPTGVFVLDAKKWSGHFTVDRDGRLLRNGARMDEDHAAKLQRRVMVLRDMIIEPGGPDPYIQATLVFVGASVDIASGSLGRTDVRMPEQLFHYLTGPQGRRGLKQEEVEVLAARAMAHIK